MSDGSNRHLDFGMDRAISGKLAAKYDTEHEASAIQWFKELIGETLTPGPAEMRKQLMDGKLLCRLAKAVLDGTADKPAACAKCNLKPSDLETPFKKMENIQKFLDACAAYGVESTFLFPTIDLYEGRNMSAVLNCILALGTEAQRHSFSGMTIGPKPSEKNVREFSDEQLAAGKTMIGLQAGTNKGASQSGMNFGKGRMITD